MCSTDLCGPLLCTGSTSQLYAAACAGRTDTCMALLRDGAALDERVDTQATPLHGCTFAGHLGVVQVLLQSRADANARDRAGQTPLFFAETRQLCEALVSGRADVNCLNASGQSALHLAAHAGLNDALEWLVGHVSHELLNLPDTHGNTPADYALRSRSRSTARLLRLRGLRLMRSGNSQPPAPIQSDGKETGAGTVRSFTPARLRSLPPCKPSTARDTDHTGFRRRRQQLVFHAAYELERLRQPAVGTKIGFKEPMAPSERMPTLYDENLRDEYIVSAATAVVDVAVSNEAAAVKLARSAKDALLLQSPEDHDVSSKLQPEALLAHPITEDMAVEMPVCVDASQQKHVASPISRVMPKEAGVAAAAPEASASKTAKYEACAGSIKSQGGEPCAEVVTEGRLDEVAVQRRSDEVSAVNLDALKDALRRDLADVLSRLSQAGGLDDLAAAPQNAGDRGSEKSTNINVVKVAKDSAPATMSGTSTLEDMPSRDKACGTNDPNQNGEGLASAHVVQSEEQERARDRAREEEQISDLRRAAWQVLGETAVEPIPVAIAHVLRREAREILAQASADETLSQVLADVQQEEDTVESRDDVIEFHVRTAVEAAIAAEHGTSAMSQTNADMPVPGEAESVGGGMSQELFAQELSMEVFAIFAPAEEDGRETGQIAYPLEEEEGSGGITGMEALANAAEELAQGQYRSQDASATEYDDGS